LKDYFKNIWSGLSFIGLKDVNIETAFLQFREIVLLNRLVSVLILLFLIYLPIEIIFNGWDLAIIILCQIFFMTGVLVFNHYKKYDIARWYFFIISILVTGPILYITPIEASNHLFLIAVSLIPVVMFKENWKIFLGFGFVFVLFFVIAFTRHLVPDVIDVPLKTLEFFSYIFNGMLFLILFFLMFYFKNNNRDYEGVIEVKSKQLKEFNEIISEKNKDITDSINYAQKIQQAYLPDENVLPYHFPESFLLFKPKDIVSGDFYWIYCPDVNGKKSDEVFVAVADCTGHGVPGAIMSVICCNALNEAVVTKGIFETGKILDDVRETIVRNLKSKNGTERKDGMDISLVKINKQTKEIQFSGANNPLWYIENGEMKEVRADKQPVGFYENMLPFTTHTISNFEFQISNLFLFTDGFADQFGGPKGKKFKYSNLQKLLLENTNLELSSLNLKLQTIFSEWKGDLEQVDDVCIIGIRI
jgi:sigma-B regulation protein RsbU (phosphoserine phosphatase)